MPTVPFEELGAHFTVDYNMTEVVALINTVLHHQNDEILFLASLGSLTRTY